MKILLNELKPRRKYWKLVFSRIRTNLLKIVITIWDEKVNFISISMKRVLEIGI